MEKRQLKFKLIFLCILVIAFSILAMLFIQPCKAWADGEITVVNVKGAQNIYANENPIVLVAGASNQTYTRIYIDSNKNGIMDDEESYYNLKISGGSAADGYNIATYNIFGGRKSSSVSGNTNVTINGGTVYSLFGDAASSSSVSGDVNITINGGTIQRNVCGCGSGSVGGNSNITINGGTININVVGAGGGSVEKNANITINGGTVIGSVYGCGGGSVGENTNVKLNGGTVQDSVYGCGGAGAVTETKTVQIGVDAVLSNAPSDYDVLKYEVVFYNEIGATTKLANPKPQWITAYENNALTNNTASLPTPAPVTAEKIVSGWTILGGTDYDFNSPVTAPIKLYAKWTAVPKYTVSFSSNGGTEVANLTDITSGSKITAPTVPTKSGYTFTGWYKESSLTNVWNFATDTVTASITLYAKWTAVPKYTVSFSSNGGTVIADLTNVVSDSKITAPTAPTKSSYTFKGWYKDAGLTDDWNFTTDTVTSNITLYAKWSYNTPTPTPDPTPIPQATNPPVEKPTITVKETPQDVPSPELISAQPVGDPFDKSVEVRLKDDPKVREEVQKALESSDTKLPENAKVFPLDISMYITGTDTKVQPKDGTAVEITCPVPKELLSDKDDLFVVCVVDGKLHILPVKIVMKNGVACAVFTASHFSPYAFVIDKDGKLATLAAGEPTLENASPLSHHNGIPFIILSFGLIAGIVIFKRRKAK